MTAEAVRIALLQGRMKTPDRPGHHDYAAGCALLERLLPQTPGVDTVVVREGWPRDASVLDDARALVCYARGGKQPFLQSPERLERMQALVDRGIGLVMIHQAVSFKPALAPQATAWLGGAHVWGQAPRGHWRTHHRDLPEHPVTRGVPPWKIRDGWLNGIRFVDGMDGVTPLVWSGPAHHGARTGGDADVVAWAYERPGGGRSFCFSGLDAHSAWSATGVRQLVVNGILWSAGVPIPEDGAPCAVDAAALRSLLTPRGSRAQWALARARRHLERAWQ